MATARWGSAVARDDYKVNGMEVSIDEDCSRILATRSPAAGDLRMIVATIKTITDLERIGDECEKIGQIAARLATIERPADRYREVKHLGRTVQILVHDTLDAFARLDADAALKTCRQDRVVDEEYESIQRQCITFMMEDPRTIRRALDVMWVVRALERIGDHAKNICEYVIYMVHGKDVRHTSLDHVERELAERGRTPALDASRAELPRLRGVPGAARLRLVRAGRAAARTLSAVHLPARRRRRRRTVLFLLAALHNPRRLRARVVYGVLIGSRRCVTIGRRGAGTCGSSTCLRARCRPAAPRCRTCWRSSRSPMLSARF